MLRRLAIVLGAAAFALPVVPAHAELYSHADHARDVTVDACLPDDDPCQSEPVVDQGWREGDILRTNIRHQSRRVLVRIREARLSSAGYRDHAVRLVTDTGLERSVSLMAFPGQAQPSVEQLYDGRGLLVRCAGLWAGYDPGTEMVTVIVPRRCLGFPRWVRVGVGSDNSPRELGPRAYDDLLRGGPIVRGQLALSPRVMRG